jgi:hypothetical protein
MKKAIIFQKLFVVISIISAVLMCACSARSNGSDGVAGTTGITATSGGTTGTGTASPTTTVPGSPRPPGTSERIRPKLADRDEGDFWIVNEVVRKLKEAGFSELSDIEVDSDDFVVILEGTVSSAEEEKRMISIAKNVPTVKGVQSELVIKK